MPAERNALRRIAFLGVDAETAPLVRAVVESRQFQLAGFCEVGSPAGDVLLGPLLARARTFDSWEALLDSGAVDAVVVARGDDEDRRADQLRKLIQVEMPLVVSHPVFDSMLLYYELDMIRRETNSLVLPCLPLRHHPAFRTIDEVTTPGSSLSIGDMEQVIVTRSVGEPTRENVLRQFARDIDLIRALAGDMTLLGAMAAGGDTARYATLGLQMSGPRGVVARWSVDPAQPEGEGQLTVLAGQGKAVLHMRRAGQPWSLDVMGGGQTRSQIYGDFDPAAVMLSQLESAVGGEEVAPDWVDAARDVELADTVDRSLAKGRTIELHYEDYTEEGTFKGTMTSVGCGLLVLVLLLLGLVAIAEQMGVPYLRHWPKLLVGALGIFLLMQLLMLVFRKRDSQTVSPAGPPTRD